jgi:hypothetical protein
MQPNSLFALAKIEFGRVLQPNSLFAPAKVEFG